jgi:hypothetical protein
LGARKSLNLLDLAESAVLRGITPSYGGSLAEAASVCLEDQGHGPVVLLEVVGAFDAEFELVRQGVTDEIRMSHNDLVRAAEDGACAVAVLLVRELSGWSAFCQAARSGRRSTRGLERGTNNKTGFDYWVGSVDDGLFQDKARLEVSGILRGTGSRIRWRAKGKMVQPSVSDATGLPAYAVVVEFGRPIAEIARR